MYHLRMGDYIRIYRAFTPHNRLWGHFYVKAFSEDHHEYMWTSRDYPWLWMAKWLGPKAARAYISKGLAQVEPSPMEIVRLNPALSGVTFETRKVPGGISTRVYIEKIQL